MAEVITKDEATERLKAIIAAMALMSDGAGICWKCLALYTEAEINGWRGTYCYCDYESDRYPE